MTSLKTPSVYTVEKNAFPNSVIKVATAIPAFIGYTAKAQRNAQSLTNVATRISSLHEFQTLFGTRAHVQFDLHVDYLSPVELSNPSFELNLISPAYQLYQAYNCFI